MCWFPMNVNPLPNSKMKRVIFFTSLCFQFQLLHWFSNAQETKIVTATKYLICVFGNGCRIHYIPVRPRA